MKKKSFVTMITALALVGTMGVGATFAYFSAKTETLTNQFVMTENGIDLGLEEIVNDDGDIVPAGEEHTYGDLVPGATVVKEPYATMEDTSLPAYVFMKYEIVGENADADGNPYLTIDEIDDEIWMDVTDALAGEGDNARYYVYVKGAEENKYAVLNPDGDKNADTKATTDPLFTEVTLSDTLDEKVTLPNIVINAAAVQAFEGDGEVSTAAALEAAKNLFSTK